MKSVIASQKAQLHEICGFDSIMNVAFGLATALMAIVSSLPKVI